MTRLHLYGAVVSIALVIGMFSFKPEYPLISKMDGYNKEENEEAKDAAGYLDFMDRMRANQITHMVDMNDVIASREQADALAASTTRSLGIEWQEMGPDNVGGRTRAILFDRINQNVVFAGGVSGGLWKSTNGGQTWTTIGDQFNSLIVASICQAANGDIYVGTGEGFYFNFGIGAGGFPGRGVFKSTDGTNFTQLAATIPTSFNSTTVDWVHVNRLAASPTDANRIYAATNKGLRITHDGGATWISPTGIVPNTLMGADVKIGSNGYVLCAVGNKYYRSTAPDGDEFEYRGGLGGFPNTGITRLELAIAPSDPNYVYATIASTSGGLGGVYKSTDNGLNWTLIAPGGSSSFNPLGFQGDYDIALGVLPTDPNTVFLGGQFSMYRYRPDESWINVSFWVPFYPGYPYIHADMHAIAFNPFNQNQMMIGCDGGLFMSDDASAQTPNFYTVNRNYRVTQMYSVAAAPTGEVIGGTQDNGTQYIDFLGNTTMSAKEISGGDGGYAEISHINPSAFFAAVPNGAIFRSASKGGGFNSFYDCRIDFNPATSSGTCGGDGVMDEGAEFVTPFLLWESEDGTKSYFAAGANSHAWLTKGALDFAITPDWFRFPATDNAVTALAFSKDGNYFYAGTSNGTVYQYSNLLAVDSAGKFSYPSISSTAAAWNAIDSGIVMKSHNFGGGRYIRGISVDPNDPNNVVVVAANYGNSAYVWRTTAATSTYVFTDITADLPKMPVYSVVIDADHPQNIVVGTEQGIYSRDINTETWTEDNVGMTRVPVLSLRQIKFYGINYLYIGTHGRGIFRSGTLAGVNTGVHTQNTVINNVTVFPNPVAIEATIRISASKAGTGTVTIYNLEGAVVKKLENLNIVAGENPLSVSVTDLQPGTYLVNVKLGASSYNQKMVVMK
jgi:hypothetical protein